MEAELVQVDTQTRRVTQTPAQTKRKTPHPPAVTDVLLGEPPHPAGALPFAERIFQLRLFVFLHLLVEHFLHVPDAGVEQSHVQRHFGAAILDTPLALWSSSTIRVMFAVFIQVLTLHCSNLALTLFLVIQSSSSLVVWFVGC